jgi:hypothetical protein
MDEALNKILHDFRIKNTIGDGNCYFRAVSYHAYGRQESHKLIRKKKIQFIRDNKDNFIFLFQSDKDFEKHLTEMSKEKTWGTDVEIIATCGLYDVDIYVHTTTRSKNLWYRYSYPINNPYCIESKEYVLMTHYHSHFSYAHLEKKIPNPCYMVE